MKLAATTIMCLAGIIGPDVNAPIFDTPDENNEKYCMALNIYHEARGEDYLSQLAVADVTMNRVLSHRFPNSVCGVISESRVKPNWRGEMVPVKHKCQFSWYCDGADDMPSEGRSWSNAKAIANNKNYWGITKGALFYHSMEVTPFWADSFIKLGTIGNHIFYRPPPEK